MINPYTNSKKDNNVDRKLRWKKKVAERYKYKELTTVSMLNKIADICK
ncbi:hypothetical protein [Candidatus Tisiphia endosymbiont of Oplodontha viridula]